MEQQYFEDEIDLREYIAVLLKHWYWIVGIALASGLVAMALSLYVMSPTYEAEALIAVTQPRYTLQFDSRFETTNIEPAYRALPDLATSNDLLQSVLTELDPARSPEQPGLKRLRSMVSASSAEDPRLVRLRVQSNDPEEAAQIANTWATLFVAKANELYDENVGEVTVLQQELAAADAERDTAEQALVDFQARNQGAILQAQLNSLQDEYNTLLSEQQQIERIIRDIKGLRVQVNNVPDNEQASFRDELTALSLQIQAFNAESSLVLLQSTGPEALSDQTATELRATLDTLSANLQDKSQELETKLAPIEPKILDLQRRIEESSIEKERLSQRLDLARETYTTLARKVEEARISNQVSEGEVKLASTAAVPESPIGPRTLINVLVAGMLGLMVGVFAAFFHEYWYHQPVEQDAAITGSQRGQSAEEPIR